MIEFIDRNLLDFCYNVLGMHCGTDLIEKVEYKIKHREYSEDTLKKEKKIIDSAIEAYDSFK